MSALGVGVAWASAGWSVAGIGHGAMWIALKRHGVAPTLPNRFDGTFQREEAHRRRVTSKRLGGGVVAVALMCGLS